jgi:hypothetical protein
MGYLDANISSLSGGLEGNGCKHYFFSLIFWNPAPPWGLLQGVCCFWVFLVFWTPFAMTGSVESPNFGVVGYFSRGLSKRTEGVLVRVEILRS